jgi:tetratricopeptide (TPR) repeat protein
MKRSVGERVPLPHPLRWAAAAIALFLATGVLVLPQFETRAADLLPPNLDPVIPSAATRTIIAGAALVVGLLALRRALLARLARKPGPVLIASFDGGSVASLPTEDVLADFRSTLTTMSISTPQSIPTEPQQDGFLDDVKTIGDASKNPIAVAATLLKALLQVKYAYRVSAQLRVRRGAESYGITVQIATLPTGRGEIETVWSDDWAECAERAAHAVGAFVLPRSRLSKRPPWTAWYGLAMPSELFHESQVAQRCMQVKRYEEALGALHAALKIDPQNPYLRIELAQAQEQLGLYLDALAGYADVVAIESWYDRRLWQRLRRLLNDDTSGRPPARVVRAPNGRQALLIARYRLVIRLAAADGLSRQWMRSWSDEWAVESGLRNRTRAAERAALRRRLTIWLKSYFRLYLKHLSVDAPPPFEVFSRESSDLMRHFFQFVGYCEAMHLIYDYRWTQRRRRPGMPVTQTALNILRVWAPLYLDYAEARVPARDWEICGRGESTAQPVWPPSPTDLDHRLHQQLWWKPKWIREWQEYYNAACTYAVALSPLPNFPNGGSSSPQAFSEARDDNSRTEPALRAVRQLERAVSSTDSGYVGTYAQWLATADEDLNHLRSTPSFVDFLDRYLPNDGWRVPRPEELLQLIMSLHATRLLYQFARQRADFWDSCGPDSDADVKDELDREPRLRDKVETYVGNDRDWLSRLVLIREARSFARRRGLPDFESALPSFQDDPAALRYLHEWQEYVKSEQRETSDDAFNRAYYDEVRKNRDGHWNCVARLFESSVHKAQCAPVRSISSTPKTPAAAATFWRELDRLLAIPLNGAGGGGVPVAAQRALVECNCFSAPGQGCILGSGVDRSAATMVAQIARTAGALLARARPWPRV